jgi:hypothetical protein
LQILVWQRFLESIKVKELQAESLEHCKYFSGPNSIFCSSTLSFIKPLFLVKHNFIHVKTLSKEKLHKRRWELI